MPSLEEDNPSNHSYKRLGSIISNRVLLQDYDRILLLTDYRVIPTLFGQEDPVRLSRNLTIASANFSTQGYRLLEVCRTVWPRRSSSGSKRLSTSARAAVRPPALSQHAHDRCILHGAAELLFSHVFLCLPLLVPRQLDFAQQRLLIPQGLSLTLKDLALGRARKTSGQGIPFFVGACATVTLVSPCWVRALGWLSTQQLSCWLSTSAAAACDGITQHVSDAF
jgi:hypothetical protein